jgi:ribonuclease J
MSEQTQLVFHGGVGVIGGNKICVRASNGKGVFLDFGWGFETSRKYLNEYMDLRKSEAILDGITLKELPEPVGMLSGIYREDLVANKDPQWLASHNVETGSPTCITEVLISHCHSDHISDISYLHPAIKIMCSETNKAILEQLDAISSANSHFSDIISYKPVYSQDSETGAWNAEAPGKNYPETKREIQTFRTSEPFQCAGGGLKVTFFETDHSMPGAGAFLIEDLGSGKKIVYTGDIRRHGPLGEQTEVFVQAAKDFSPDVMVVEGTRITEKPEERDEKPDEATIEKELNNLFAEINKENDSKLICFDCANYDVWRLSSFFRSAANQSRTLVLNAKSYSLLKLCVDFGIITDVDYTQIRIYLPKKVLGLYAPKDYSYSQDLKIVLKKSQDEIPVKKKRNGENKDCAIWETIDPNKPFAIRAAEIRENPGNFVIHLPFYTLMEFCDLLPPENSHYIISKSAPFDDEGLIDEKKRKYWLELCKIPKENVHNLHCSGHMRRDDLIEMVNSIQPKQVFPVHTGAPAEFEKMGFQDQEIEVILPIKGEIYII